MERLQAAINKARQDRGDRLTQTQARSAPKPSEDTAQNVPQRAEQSSEVSAAPVRKEADAGTWGSVAPLLARPKLLQRHRIIAFERTTDSAPYDMLRTRIVKEMNREGYRRLMVTSPTSSCGKTTTCCNLAYSLSHQDDLKTIVIEADLRRPAIAKMLGVSSGQSFYEVLDGRADFASQAKRIGNSVLMGVNFGPARSPSELLQSKRTAEVLNEIEAAFQPDLMIFDLPPLLANDDALGFTKNVDCALLMAMAERTTTADLDVCERDLASHTNVLGVVLNRCRYATSQYGYDY
ncbi:MAG: CpsD/CapB family tyrosine-protein kinase [Pseudomonadota bacterium]